MMFQEPIASVESARGRAPCSRRQSRRQRGPGCKLTATALAAALCMAAVTGTHAQTNTPESAVPIPSTGADAAAAIRHAKELPENGDLYLEVTVCGRRSGQIAHFREQDGRLYANADDLGAVGLRLPGAHAGPAHGDSNTEIPLDDVPGLTYRYDIVRQSISIDVPDSLRTAYLLDMHALARAPQAAASRGFVLNYDAYAVDAHAAQTALWTEARYFDSHGVFSNTGTAYLYSDLRRYVRFDTWWRQSNVASLSTTQFGDTISSSLDWSRSLRIGGIQWRSNFALRPDLVTFPVPSLTGSAVVPTSVDLYVNNVRQYTGTVPSGPFVISNVPGITGAGEATVVTRDALGRAVTTTVPLYMDTRLLAAGLSSYSVEAGFLRKAYGIQSFGYDPHPVASGSYRHGLSDELTVEAHAEATGGLYDAGAGALVRLGQFGVVNGSLAASTGQLTGAQVGLGYQLIEQAFSVQLDTLRATSRYGDLAARDGAPVARDTDRATLSLPLPHNETAALSYVGYRYPNSPAAHIASLSYTVGVSNVAAVTVSAFRNFASSATSGAFVSVSFGIGGKASVNGSAGRENGKASFNVNASRVPDYDGGWGWAVQDGGTGENKYQQAQVQYLGRYGQVTALGQMLDGKMSASLDMSGSVVLMDGAALPARRIDDGFALISTDGVSGVPVLHENRLIGATDSHGHLLVPDLTAYQANMLSIDSMSLPVESRIASTSANVVPQALSGVLAKFSITQYRAATVILRGPDGELLPVGASVHLRETNADTIVGYDGMTFIDNLQDDNHLSVVSGALHCAAEFHYVRPKDASLPTYGPFTCKPLSGETP